MSRFHNIVPLLILISIISTPALTAAFSAQSSSSSSSLSASPLKLRLNQENTIIQSNRQWTRVKLAFYDLKEPTVRYDEYPQGWSQVLDYLYVPAEKRKVNRKYPCRITVKSKNGPEYKASVVFLIGNQKLIVSDLLFNYDEIFDDDFYNSGIFSGRPVLITEATATSKINVQQKTEDSQMQNKKIAVQKMNAVSSTPGAGIYDVLNGIEGNKKTVSLTNLINSIKLKQQLKPNVQSQSIPSNSVQNQFTSSSVSASSQKNAASSGNSQNKNSITSGAIIKSNPQVSPKNIQQAATINSFTPTFATNQFTQTLSSPDVGSVLQPESNLGLNQISPIPNLSVESGSTSSSQLASGSTSSSSSSASISSSSSSSSASNSITGSSNSVILPSSFPPSSSSVISASALLLPTPNNLSPGTPNILDNPNLTASQKQQVLIKTIKQTQIQETSQQKSIESFFFKLPGPQQLDSIILTADSFAILKTIQAVVQSDLDCQQKISYLSDFLGRIQAAISLKAFSASQLAVIVQSAQQEVTRLQKQIQQNKQFIASLGVQQLRAKLNEVQEQLQIAYSNYNNAEVEVTAKNEEIAKLKLEIELTSSSSTTSNEITAQKLQLLQLTTSISTLESQYKEAIARRESITSNIQKLTQSISASQTIISTSQTKIIELQKQRRQKQSSSEQIKLKYQALQVSIERQRSQIASREKKLSEVSLLVKNLEQRLEIAQAKTNNVEISRLTSFVASLQIIVANVTTQIDDVTFRCNYLQQYSNTSTTTNTTIYTIPIKQYTNYLQSSYQPSSSSTKIDFSINSIVNALTSYITSSTNLKNQYQYNQALSQIKVTPVSILDGSWLSAFGNPYSSGSYTQAKEFYFYDDFQCSEQANLETGSGLIRAVNKKAIDVSSGSKVYKLNLGACSRIQSTNQLPKVGQKIFYRAQKVNNNNNEYNLYKASCI